MKKLRGYLKRNWRGKVRWFNAFMVGLCLLNIWLYGVQMAERDESVIFVIAWSVLGLLYLYGIFFKTPGEKEPEFDPRPTDVKLREAFAELTQEELQAIIDDKLRSEETKAVARDLLEKMQ